MRDLVPKLDRGRIDAVVGLLEGDAAAGALFSEPYMIAMAAGHPLASRETVSADDVAAETMIVRRQCEALPLVSAFFTARGVRPFMAARTLSDERAMAYVRAGLGITVAPRCQAEPGVAMVRLAGFDQHRTIGVRTAPEAEGRLQRSAAFTRFCTEVSAAGGPR